MKNGVSTHHIKRALVTINTGRIRTEFGPVLTLTGCSLPAKAPDEHFPENTKEDRLYMACTTQGKPGIVLGFRAEPFVGQALDLSDPHDRFKT